VERIFIGNGSEYRNEAEVYADIQEVIEVGLVLGFNWRKVIKPEKISIESKRKTIW